MAVYGISREVGTLGVSLYVLGFATGPIIWASFSELKGRYYPIVVSVFGFMIFSFATAASKDLSAIFICRYFGGVFAAGPMTVAGAVNADMFDAQALSISMVMFSLMVFIGPMIAQFIGGFIVMNPSLGWEWTEYLPGILGAAVFVALAMSMDESYHPVILARKADRLRRETGDWSIIAKHDTIKVEWGVIVRDYLFLPLRMLTSDPIILCMSTFGSFVYGLLYLFLTAYPVVFQEIHHMSPGVGGLPYLGVIIGQIFFVAAMSMVGRFWVAAKMKQNGGKMMPEWHLPIAIPGAMAFSAGLFWLGWTGYKSTIHPIVPTLSGLLTGFGLLGMFVPSIAYIVQARPERFVTQLFGVIS
jgi:DHA1 family multidrug resistance protein-like MFS transporter